MHIPRRVLNQEDDSGNASLEAVAAGPDSSPQQASLCNLSVGATVADQLVVEEESDNGSEDFPIRIENAFNSLTASTRLPDSIWVPKESS